jgi:hypothetical protein
LSAGPLTPSAKAATIRHEIDGPLEEAANILFLLKRRKLSHTAHEFVRAISASQSKAPGCRWALHRISAIDHASPTVLNFSLSFAIAEQWQELQPYTVLTTARQTRFRSS